jgi:nitrogen fixation/metabolism regulation signal transduction histidine kinase
MRVWLASTALLGLILLYLLAISTGNTSRLAEYYWEIFSLTSLLTVGLIGFIGRQLWQIRQKIQAKVFGAKLTLRMVAMFALVAILPGILMFTVSVQFLTKSIESWFDVRVEAGLDRGLSLGRNALDYLLTDLDYKAQQVARELNGAPALSATLKLPALRNQLGVHEIAVFDRHGQLIAAAGEPGAGAEPPQAPSREVLERIANGQPFRTTETLAGRGMVLRVALPAYPLGFNNERLTVQLSQPAPRQIAEDAELVDATRSEYRQLALSREGLKRFYRLTLALTLVGTEHFAWAMILVLSVPALVAFIFGFFAFRSKIKGVYFSIITQAMTFAAALLFFRNETGFGGNNGFTGFKTLLGFDITSAPMRATLCFVTALVLMLMLPSVYSKESFA